MATMNLYGKEFCVCGCMTEYPRHKRPGTPVAKKDDGFYQFSVSDVKDIDLNRIVREQYESGNLVTLLTDGKEPKGLLIHKEFLARFSPEDNIFLAGYKLYPNVGYGHLRAEYKGGSYRLMGETQGESLGDVARLLYISPQEMDKLPAELAVARAFTRKITVKVHTL